MKDVIRWTRTPSNRFVVCVGQRAGIGANTVATLQTSVAYSNSRKKGEEVKRHDGDWGMWETSLTSPVVVLSFPLGLRDGFLGLCYHLERDLDRAGRRGGPCGATVKRLELHSPFGILRRDVKLPCSVRSPCRFFCETRGTAVHVPVSKVPFPPTIPSSSQMRSSTYACWSPV